MYLFISNSKCMSVSTIEATSQSTITNYLYAAIINQTLALAFILPNKLCLLATVKLLLDVMSK